MGLLDWMDPEKRYGPFVHKGEAQALLDRGGLVLDVRSQKEWDEGHGPKSLLIPIEQLQGRLAELPKDRPLLVCCAVGGRAKTAVDFLHTQGFEAVNLGGWQQDPDVPS